MTRRHDLPRLLAAWAEMLGRVAAWLISLTGPGCRKVDRGISYPAPGFTGGEPVWQSQETVIGERGPESVVLPSEVRA